MQENWYQNAVFYGIDIRRFQDSNDDGYGDLQGLISRLDYLADLGVNGLWLLPFFDTPFGDNGYDIRDYFQIDPRVGTLDDFMELVEQAKKRDIRLVIDLVMNHTSDQHPWFQASRRDPSSRYRDYYVWVDQPPQETINGVPIFPGEEESVWTYDPVAGAYYFHRFYHFQPDLCISNPLVQEEIFRVVDFWLSLGVSGFRFDAAPIMLETKGLPEAKMEDPHRLFRDLHSAIIQRHPQAVLLGEANVSMDLMDQFFGGGSEMNLLFNFLLGPHILLALAKESAIPVATYLNDLLVPPPTDEWVNFLRNLDELSLEKMPEEQNKAIYAAFSPEEDMRIYGRGIRRRLAPMLAEGHPELARQRIELAFSLSFSFPGVPLIMYGDEIGIGEDLSLPGRNSVRLPMQWSGAEYGGFSTTAPRIAPALHSGPYGYPSVNVDSQLADPASLLNFVKRLIAVWKSCLELGLRNSEVLDTGDPRVLAHCYNPVENGQRALVIVHNLSSQPVSTAVAFQAQTAYGPETLLARGEILAFNQKETRVQLPAFGYLWIRA